MGSIPRIDSKFSESFFKSPVKKCISFTSSYLFIYVCKLKIIVGLLYSKDSFIDNGFNSIIELKKCTSHA